MITHTLLIAEHDTDDATVVALTGPLSVGTIQVLEQALNRLAARRPHNTVFDLAGVTTIASLAMGALVTFRRAIHRHGGVVTLANPTPMIREALGHARLDRLFNLEPAEAAATTTSAPE